MTLAVIVDDCLKCGKCCYLTTFDREGKVLRTSIKCPHLTRNNLCIIYNHRPDWCLTAEQMTQLNILPSDCGYSKEI